MLPATSAIVFLTCQVCLFVRTREAWIIAAVVCGTACVALLAAWSPAQYRAWRAGRDYPDTPEARAYHRRKREELLENDKNSIELK